MLFWGIILKVWRWFIFLVCFKTEFLLFFIYFLLFRAAPTAYGGSQTRGPIGAVVAGLYHSYSNTRSEPHLQPTPQLTGSLTHWARPGIEPTTSWFLVGFVSAVPRWKLPQNFYLEWKLEEWNCLYNLNHI